MRKEAKILLKTVDDELAYHLEKAEYHLIEAIKLFSREKKPIRRAGYQRRLGGAQEAVTVLYREELVRIRGPQYVKRAKKAIKMPNG